jgi:hypothetical protein
MLVELFMSDDHAKLIAKVQHYYNFLDHKKEECNLEFVQNNSPDSFRQIRDYEDMLLEFKKTFETNIYMENQS